uniref:Uncharacterized protein n=1 Tax=viral metagenome TaxID=1070528 RepID=A0A6C0CK55_9ZZZZ
MVSVKIEKSDRDGKKMKAIFYDNNGKKIKTTHFGASGYTDFIKSGGDEDRKKRYLARHTRNNEDWNDYMSAGALSRFILWNLPTLSASISSYKKKFNLK